MDIRDILNRLHGVKGGDGQWLARCPAHDDRHQSLSLSVGQDGRILLKCHAGCAVENIVSALGLSMKDLFSDTPAEIPRGSAKRAPVTATYDFCDDNGKLLAQKLRRADKSFTWRRPDGKGGWIYDRKGVPHRLYVAGKLEGSVFLAEGEKDVDTLHSLGFNAVSGADGAGPGKWRKEYTQQLKGMTVAVFQDNDQPGKEFALETCKALHGVAERVYLLDISRVWPDIPEKGDVTDLVERFGPEEGKRKILELTACKPWTPPPDEFLSCFKTLDSFEEEEAAWLVPGWIPEGQITLLAADGGVGKTSLWVNIIAGVSSGSRCILDPPEHHRTPQRVAFLTTEDSIRKKLKRKLRMAGANMANIISPDFLADKTGALRDLKFGRPELEKFVRHFKPALCVFDPVQGFIPPDVNMGSRNAMRDCMAPLIALGEETGTTFLIIAHTNKRPKASGRDRIADSADLWDISRSVVMLGYAEEQGIRYISNEKNNYTQRQETILFSVNEDGQPRPEGTSWKRDREFSLDAAVNAAAPKKEGCKEWLQQVLREAGGAMPSKDVEEKSKLAGYSFITLRRAKEELKKAGITKNFTTGSAKGGDRVWHIQLVDLPQFTELPADTPTPFD